VEKVFNIVGSLLDKGVDVRRLTSDLLNLLKDALIFARTENSELMHILRQNEAETVVNMFNLQTLNMVIENLLKAQADYRFASDVKNIFEITLLKIINEIGLQAVAPQQTSAPVSVQKAPTPKAPLPEKKEEKPLQQPAVQDEVPPFMAPKPKPVVIEPKPEPKPETVIPPKPVVKKPSNEKLHKDGTEILLTDDVLIKILTLADRDEKMKLRNERWDDLALLAMDADFGDHAALLSDGQPYALANEILIMEFNFGRNAKYINLKENQKVIQDIMSTLLGRRIPVYGLTHEQAVMLTRKYRSMSQVNKLPKVKSVNDELEGKF
jgi:DNA polymerase-3 subunit gamma/tau